MTKTFGLLSLVAALAVGGYLFSAQARSTGPASELGERAQADATSHAAAANLHAAAPALQAWHAENGTYAGATLPPALDVVLVRADRTSYCLQAGTGAAAQHVAGPGGSPSSGTC